MDFKAITDFALSLVGLGYIYGAQGQICTPAFRAQQAKQYPEQYNNIMIVGAKWDGMAVWECAQLTQEVASVGGAKLISGATSQWKKTDWAEKGEIDTLPIDRIAFLYRESTSDENVMSHTGVYLGDGTVVDARSASKGVRHDKISEYPWTHWAIPAWGEQTTKRPTLRNGSRGDAVVELQNLLLKHGHDLGKWGVDGKFGDATETAVRLFQSLNGLYVDGIVGVKTWAALEADVVKPSSYTVILHGLTEQAARNLVAQYGGEMKASEGSS